MKRHQNSINLLKELEQKLGGISDKHNVSPLGAFTIMFNEEEGTTIEYVRNMPLENLMSNVKDIYDKNSDFFNTRNKDIEWPYSGFVHGNMGGSQPVEIPIIVKWLENSHVYKVNEFIDDFYSYAIKQIEWIKKNKNT